MFDSAAAHAREPEHRVDCDVAVVGAGPAGAMTAWALAMAGVDVAMLDRSPFPRDKVCGDALLPDAVQALEEAGLAGAVRGRSLAVARADFRSPRGRTIGVHGEFLTIRRLDLDALLLEAAIAAGARFLPGLVATSPYGIGTPDADVVADRVPHSSTLPCGILCEMTHGWTPEAPSRARPSIDRRGVDPSPSTASTNRREPAEGARLPSLEPGFRNDDAPDGGASVLVRCRAIVLACGSNPRLLERFGVLTRPLHSAIAVRTYIRDNPFPEDGGEEPSLFISYERSLLPGYGWSFPLPGGGWNVGCGVFLDAGSSGERRPRPGGSPDLRALLRTFLTDQPHQHLKEARGATLRTGFTGAHAVRGRVLVVGEALGLTLPLTGDGIGKAMQSGLVAAHTVTQALKRSVSHPDLRPYAEAMEARTRQIYRSYATAQRWMRAPFVSDLVVQRAGRSAALRGLIEEIVAERTDPRALLSPLGLLKAVFLS